MSEFVAVVCTDRGQHARTDLGHLMVREDGSVDSHAVRKGPSPIISDIGKRMYVAASDAREDYQGTRRWRWVCPRCGRDVPLSDENMTAIAREFVAAARRAFDISHLPTH